MAKDKEIITQTTPTQATAPVLADLALMEGESTAMSLSRMAVYAGTAEEEKKYGDGFKRGDFIDTLDIRKIGTSVKVVVVTAWRSWVKFDEQGQLIYSTKIRGEVPQDDLVNQDEGGNWIKPAATECVNAVLVVEGESWPYLFIFKKTALKAWESLIAKVEARRSATGQGRGMYDLYTVDEKNANGQPYKRLMAKPLGNPTPELASLAANVAAHIAVVRKDAEEKAADADAGETAPPHEESLAPRSAVQPVTAGKVSMAVPPKGVGTFDPDKDDIPF